METSRAHAENLGREFEQAAENMQAATSHIETGSQYLRKAGVEGIVSQLQNINRGGGRQAATAGSTC